MQLTSFLMNATRRLPLASIYVLLVSNSSLSRLSPDFSNSCWSFHARARSFSLFARLWPSSSVSTEAAVGVAKGTERSRADSILAEGAKVEI